MSFPVLASVIEKISKLNDISKLKLVCTMTQIVREVTLDHSGEYKH